MISLDEDAGRICLKIGNKADPYEAALSLIPPGPGSEVLGKRFIGLRTRDCRQRDYSAISSILKRERPRVKGLRPGDIVPAGADFIAAAVSAIRGWIDSHMLVQGPPGTGKTFLVGDTPSWICCRRGVGSAWRPTRIRRSIICWRKSSGRRERGVQFRGAKKCSGTNTRSMGR